jgi:6-phosphogluconolactonase (cycloisomerase 2 family)
MAAVLAIASFLSSCGSVSSSSSGGTGGGGGSSLGGFAAGVGGAGQTSSAKFLVAIQVPGGTPFATMIDSTGTLTQATVTMNSNHTEFNPMAMTAAIDPSGTFFYQAVQPGIWAFTIDRQTGNLTEMTASPYDDTVKFDSVAVDQLGKFLYAYDDSGNVYAYTIQSGTGQLSAIAGSPFAAAASGEQFALSADRTAVSQDNKYLYVATEAGIFAYAIDATTGALTAVAGSPFGASAGSGFALSAPSSGFLYETILSGTPTSPGIYGYSIDSSTGALTQITGSPFAAGCGGSDLTSPANGKFMFIAGCGMYQIDASTGALSQVAKDPEAPNDGWSSFDPTSSFVWIVTSQQPCFNCEEGVDAYQVDANTGAMTLVPNSFFAMTNSQVGGISALAITH